MMHGLAGKKAIITGGARGIGLATVQRLHDEGVQVAVIDSNRKDCEKLRSQLPETTVVEVDVTDASAVEAVFKELTSKLNGLDILFNNAGISSPSPFLNLSAANLQQTIAVNVEGVFYCAQAAAQHMKKAGSGVIINMGSVSGMLGMPDYSDYNATKAAVIELTRTLAIELAPALRVVCISPGYVLTPMQEAEYSPDEMTVLNARIPMKRHADPKEIAALVAFLASDEAPFITGSNIVIDGGESAGGTASL